MTTLCWSCVLSLLLLASVSHALDFPPWMPGAQIVQLTDLPFQGVMGTVHFSDINDTRDVVGNRDYGNFGGFLLKKSGTETYLNCPGAVPYSTTAQSLNKHVDVVGSCTFPSGEVRGYLYGNNTPSNPYRLITIAGSKHVEAYAVNDHRHVGGGYLPANSAFRRGFWWSNGGIQNIDVPWPGRKETVVHAVLNNGKMAGIWVDGNDNYRGFTRANGISTMVDVPGARWTILLDMNDQEQLTGWYRGWDDTVGAFLFDKGQWFTVEVAGPTVVFTEITGFNNRTEVAGRVGLAEPGSAVEVVSRGLVLLPSLPLLAEVPPPAPVVQRGSALVADASTTPRLIPDWPAGYQPKKGRPLPW